MKMIDILRHFLRGERLGNWPLHLQVILEMLAFFAASGHYNYLKSCYIYLQEMVKLQVSHPDVYNHFAMVFMSFEEVTLSGLVSPVIML